jgi:hypothetical protein
MKTILSLIALVLFSSPVYGDDGEEGKRVDLQLGIGSVHFQHRKDGKPWNDSNTGIAIEYIFPGTLWKDDVEYCATAGQFKNSEFGGTLFAGGCVRKAVLEFPFGKISIGVFAGVMTYPSRYNSERKASNVFAVILPTASASVGKGVYLDATFVPKVQANNANASAALLFTVRITMKHW